MSSIGYRPEIDGFRALAVIPVILFHLKWAGMRGGYLGVDVFFVISGYLITSIVTHELAAGTFTFRGFWARRIRRIFPALLVMVATTLAVSSRFVFKGDQSAIGEQTLAVLFSVANLHFRKNIGDYWGADASHSPVLHTWSLSVEEQFYLFFPALIWLVVKFRRRWLPGVILCIAVASLGLFLRETKSHPTIAFYLLRTRAWELATGCLLAVVCRGREKIPTAATSENENILGLAGLAMVIASYFLVTSLDGGLIIPVFGAALVIAFGQTGICRTLLSQRPLVSVGKISYSLYLWHWPVIVFAERFGVTNSHFHSSLLCALMLVLATASYVFIERPTRRRPRVIPLIVAAYPLVWGFAAHLAFSENLYDTGQFEQPVSYQGYYDLRPRPEPLQSRLAATIRFPQREAPADAYLHGGFIVGEGNLDQLEEKLNELAPARTNKIQLVRREKTDGVPAPQIVVLGDSHGTMWSQPIREITEKFGLKTSFYSISAVTPFVKFPLQVEQAARGMTPQEKHEFDVARIESIRKWKPAIVIICTIWSERSADDAADLMNFLTEHAGHILLMEQPPLLASGNRNVQQWLCYQDVKPVVGKRQYAALGSPADYQRGRTLIRQLESQYSNCSVIPVYDVYCEDSQALVLDGKSVVYFDDDHLTHQGSLLALPRIEEKIIEVLPSALRLSESRRFASLDRP